MEKPRNPLEKIEEVKMKSAGDVLLIDEFEIIELEDRLELAGRCNNRCAPEMA